MPKYQYRMHGRTRWIASSGSALFALFNKLGSGKRITLRSAEVQVSTVFESTTATTLSAGPATVSGLVPLKVTKRDSNAPNWPSNIVVSVEGFITTGTRALNRSIMNTLGSSIFLSSISRNNTINNRFKGSIVTQLRRPSGVIENVVVRPGQAWAAWAFQLQRSFSLMVNATLKIGSRYYSVSEFCSLVCPNQAFFSIQNNSTGTVVEVVDVSVSEVGNIETPYLQLVPISGINAQTLSDGDANISILKMDTSYPNPNTWVTLVQNTPVIPYGVPEAYFNDGSPGSPKGMNYLHTRDFLGPVWRSFFPEMCYYRTFFNNDTRLLNFSHLDSDLLVRRSRITIRPGEGVALVSSAEVAANLTQPVSVGGWPTLDFSLTFDVENINSPFLTLTNLKPNTEVRVYTAGTGTHLAGEENNTTGTFSWNYDPDDVSNVDIAVLALGYQNIRFANVSLPPTGLSIPIQQQLDRQYLNP